MSGFSNGIEVLIAAEMAGGGGPHEIILDLIKSLAKMAAASVPDGSKYGDAILTLCHDGLDEAFTKYRNVIAAAHE